MTASQVFRAVLVVLLTLAGAYILLLSIRVIMVLLTAIIIASAIRPYVDFLVRHGVPLGAAIVTVYATLLAVFAGLMLALVPPIVNQAAEYLENDYRLTSSIFRAERRFESAIEDITGDELNLINYAEVDENVERFIEEMRDVTPTLVDDAGTVLGEALLIFVMGAYWLTSHERAITFITQLSPLKHRQKTADIINEIESTMGAYVRSVVLIASIVGAMNFVVFTILGVPNALTLAVIIAITTMIPMIGGILGSVLAVFMTLLANPDYVPLVIITTLVIQQIENHVLTPRIISRRVQIDSLLVIVYSAIGFLIFGIVGALIAVPVMRTIHILLMHLVIEPHKEKIKAFETQEGLPVVRADDKPEQPASGLVTGP